MSRPPNTGPSSGPPLSFKPVPGRHRTQKWNVAKQYDYSGDDWGGYDGYDEYGGAQQQSAPSNFPPQPNYPSQLPSQQGRTGRQMSFDREGDEQRQFNAPPILHGANSDRSGGVSPARSAVSATSSGGSRSGEFQRPPAIRPRDFTNPDQAPPPLNPGSRASPALSSSPAIGPAGSPSLGSSATFPPRKTSLSTGSPASEVVASATAGAAKQEKELPTPPFIRPSDIYKRMAAEQERERRMSEDTSRPSLESLQQSTDSPSNLSVSGRQQRPLSAVEEGPGESPPPTASATLPSFQGISTYGSEWFGDSSGSGTQQTPSSAQSVTPKRSIPVPSYMRATPVATTATSADPAAEILAERTHQTPVSEIGRQPDTLAHQPSDGYRSVVNRAFDQSAQPDATTPTRDDSQSTVGVSRSGSESTSGISPIMSRVPLSRELQQQEREAEVPTIVEEHAGGPSGATSPINISRKPTPTQSRSPSTERDATVAAVGAVAAGAAAVGVAAGYRRSYEPPEADNSPARTPDVQNADRRLSDGLAAEPGMTALPSQTSAENAAVHTGLQSAETPAAETTGPSVGALSGASIVTDAANTSQPTGRARAGTDYSVRESDIAAAVSNNGTFSDELRMSPAEAAKEEQAEQNLFLQTHATTPPTTSLPTLDTAGAPSPIASPASGRGTPVKSRVREIAEKYQGLHEASRRNSQTSLAGSTKSANTWSQVDSEENFTVVRPGGSFSKPEPPSRQNTGSTWDTNASEDNEIAPAVVSDSPTKLTADEDNTKLRPEVGRETSFRPQLPGGWVSYQDTPNPAAGNDAGGELLPATTYSQATPRASRDGKRPAPEEVDLTPTTRAVPLAVPSGPAAPSHFDQAKVAGTALGAAFLSSAGAGHQTRDFGSSEPAAPVDQPEMRPKAPIGELGYLQPTGRPELNRGDTDTTDMTDIASAASSVPPTPPVKDPTRSSDYYFTVTPLRTGRSRDVSPDHLDSSTLATAPRPGIAPAMSTWTRPTDTESDRLRKEIVRSLDPEQMKQNIQEDNERTQDALDAPINAQRVAEGKDASPPAEMVAPRPGLLGQRFSWEKDPESAAVGAASQNATPIARTSVDKQLPPPPIVKVPEPEESPEIKPEMPYERPRSRGLHIMNADEESDEDERPMESRGLSAATSSAGPVSPITKSQENLHMGNMLDSTRDGGEGLSAPSPVDESRSNSVRLPSYYMLDIPGLGQSTIQDEDAAASAPELAPEEVAPDTPAKDMPSSAKELPAPQLDTDAAVQPGATSMPSPTSPTSKQKIPPFREILAIKSPNDRIKAYDDTRQTFADMNTGLSEWLGTMIAQHPEHAILSNPRGSGGYTDAATALGNLKGHKSSPSLAKFTRNFSGAQAGGSPSQPGDYQAGAEPMHQRTPTKDYGDMDKLQQRGKDLMKGASVLGGKAGASAKGLLAKGKSRFGSTRDSRGGSKDLSSSSTTPSPAPRALDRSDPDPTIQPVPTSSKPATPLLSPTLDAPLSRTPSNKSALSRTLSRLRSRSRSKSASRSGGNSRPTSMILRTSDWTSVEEPPYRPERVGTEPAETTRESVISPWEEPDGAAHADEETTPKRLGVLPSPTTSTFASADGDSPPRTVDSDAPPLPALDWDSRGLSGEKEVPRPLDRPAGEENDASVSGVSPLGREETSSREVRPDDDDDDELYTSTPRASNGPDMHARDVGGVTDLDETTPKASQDEWRSIPTSAALAEKADEITALPSLENNAAAGAERPEDTSMDNSKGDATSSSHDSTAEHGIATIGATAGAALIAHTALEHAERSHPTDDVDHHSQVSAEEHSQDPAVGVTNVEQDRGSRRSSVSSLGEPEQEHVTVQPPAESLEEPPMPIRAAPAEPMGTVSPIPPSETETPVEAALPVESAPKGPTYLAQPPEIPRQLSYEPLRRDASGALVQETLPMASQNLPPDPEDEWMAATAFNTTTLTRHRKVSIPTPDRKNKRVSGMYYKDDVVAPTRSEEAVPDPIVNSQPRQTSGHFMEDAAALQPEEPKQLTIADRIALSRQRELGNTPSAQIAQPVPRVSGDAFTEDGRQARRKSGIWDAFRRSPSTSKQLDDAAPPRARDVYYAPQAAATFPRASTQQDRPHRASTTAAESDKKKKRFSALGSIFGRSSTTGHKSEHSRKLTKSHGHAPNDTRKTSLQWPDSSDSSVRNAETPPQLGWYAPTDNPLYEPGFNRYPPAQQIYPESAQTVRRGNAPYSNVPEAFRPVESSFGKPVRPIGPPPHSRSPPPGTYQQERMPYQERPGQLRNDSQGRPMSYLQGEDQVGAGFDSAAPQIRQLSYGSEEDALSPQISGRSDWERNGRQVQNTLPAISPAQTRPGPEPYASNRDPRFGPLPQDLRYHPTQAYANAPTPMQPSTSPTGAAPGSSRTSYWARQRRGQPTSPGARDGYNYLPAIDNSQRAGEDMSQVPRHVQPPTPTNYGEAISTDDPAVHARLSHEGNYSSRRQRASMQNPSPAARQYSEEEPVQMRGVSYPGQEWAPDQWD